jgi:sugar-specific transcriptional regulator TrmB
MDTSILQDIGLTGAEIKVFITLLELGSSTAGKVVEKSGLQNAVVHRAFRSLIEKGLITYVIEGKIKNYQSIEPKLLLNFIEDKKIQLEKLLPELEIKKNKAKEKPQARIFQGIRGIKEIINLMLETNSKEYFSYGGAKISNETLEKYFWENFHRRRITKKIQAKLLFHQSLKEWGTILSKKKLTLIRYTPQKFEELTETIICGNKVAIIIYSEKPFGFFIEEELVSKSYKEFFQILWKTAKK